MLPRLFLILCLLLPVQAMAERRVALVLAAEDYRSLRKLDNPVNDAVAVEGLLSGLGFEVTVETNRDLKRMRRALDDFREDGAGADVALLFYAGHGVEIAGVNYLLPVDAQVGSAQAVAESALPLSEVQAALASVAPIGIVLLDACREDPWGGGGAGQGRSAVALEDAVDAPRPGLGRVGRADGVLFAFSAAPGEVAADGDGVDSPFTEALLRHFATPGVEVRTALTLVQQDVYDRSRGKQLPYIESGLPRLFFAASVGELGERDRLLVAMAGLPAELRAEVEALAQQKDMPLAPLYGALMSADLAGKDRSARAQALVQSAESFLRFRAQVQLLSADDPKVAEFRAEAEQALDLGAFDLARTALDKAAKLDAEAREALRDNYRSRALSEAQTHALAASAAKADLRYDLAMADLTKALALYAELEGDALPRADREAYTDLMWDQGDLLRNTGNTSFALRSYRAWEAVAAARVAGAPEDADFRRNWSVARVNIGDMLLLQGDLDGAEAEFRAALAVDEVLAARADAPLKWRHDVVVSQSKLGDVAQLRGDLAGALARQQAGLAVLRQLVIEYPARDDVRGDLGLSLDRIGDLRKLAGDPRGALVVFNEALALRQALLEKLPTRDDLQGDLAISFDKIGDVFLALADPKAAQLRFKAEIALLEALVAKDAGQTKWQNDLAMGYLKLGDARAALGARDEAAQLYAKALKVREKLAALDPANADWQRSVALAQARLGDLAFKAADFTEAERRFTAAFAISQALAKADPGNVNRQQDLASDLDRLGDVALMRGDPVRAQNLVQRSYAITAEMAARDPGNVENQMNLVASLVRMAVYDDDTRPRQREALAVLKALQAEGRLDPGRAHWIGLIEAQLAAP
ncbi:caspase family protein [Cypionkella psychrotolerans]|uniref:caspase family protein n=1 Tax=Cypionkella psychrotolerans TaxID=1678131 RepID=UPI0006B4517F|nr:caspase family protein [Cypionkella psychrotolerans]